MPVSPSDKSGTFMRCLDRAEHKKDILVVLVKAKITFTTVDMVQNSIIYITVSLVYTNKEKWLNCELTY